MDQTKQVRVTQNRRGGAVEPAPPHHAHYDQAYRIMHRVCTLREIYPHYGKEKLRVLLREEGIGISASTIGRIIARNHLPGAPRPWVAKRKRVRRTRLPRGFMACGPCGLVSLHAILFQQGKHRKYVGTALDHTTRLGIVRTYPRLSSRQAHDALHRMQIALGLRIERVLTYNGSEVFGVFDEACTTEQITHFWTYPRSPKTNARMERFNRTIQEEVSLPLQTPWKPGIGRLPVTFLRTTSNNPTLPLTMSVPSTPSVLADLPPRSPGRIGLIQRLHDTLEWRHPVIGAWLLKQNRQPERCYAYEHLRAEYLVCDGRTR